MNWLGYWVVWHVSLAPWSILRFTTKDSSYKQSTFSQYEADSVSDYTPNQESLEERGSKILLCRTVLQFRRLTCIFCSCVPDATPRLRPHGTVSPGSNVDLTQH